MLQHQQLPSYGECLLAYSDNALLCATGYNTVSQKWTDTQVYVCVYVTILTSASASSLSLVCSSVDSCCTLCENSLPLAKFSSLLTTAAVAAAAAAAAVALLFLVALALALASSAAASPLSASCDRAPFSAATCNYSMHSARKSHISYEQI
jgi:hypothetical protein